jgi:predicted O-methyltransferase YrrM
MNKLYKLTSIANGMLPKEVYEEIYQASAARRPRLIVEIGTAHGAATIALGLGAMTQNSEVSIKTVDKLGGRFSSRSAYGDVETNRAIVERNFAQAGMSDKVQLFVGDPDEFAAKLDPNEQIDLLMLDADGRIDRDLLNLYPQLAIGAPVIIDDADNDIWLGRNHEGVPFIDNKHRTTELLLDGFCAAGFLRLEKRIANTAFCTRTDKPYDRQAFAEIALAAYRQLVICEVNNHYWEELTQWSAQRADIREAIRIRGRIPARMVRLMHRAWSMLRRLRDNILSR